MWQSSESVSFDDERGFRARPSEQGLFYRVRGCGRGGSGTPGAVNMRPKRDPADHNGPAVDDPLASRSAVAAAANAWSVGVSVDDEDDEMGLGTYHGGERRFGIKVGDHGEEVETSQSR